MGCIVSAKHREIERRELGLGAWGKGLGLGWLRTEREICVHATCVIHNSGEGGREDRARGVSERPAQRGGSEGVLGLGLGVGTY